MKDKMRIYRAIAELNILENQKIYINFLSISKINSSIPRHN